MTEKKILTGINWAFIGEKYKSIQAFNDALKVENTSLPLGSAFDGGVIRILCEYVNEDDIDLQHQFLLYSEDGKSFSVSELLFKIHNEVVELLDENDFHFFEGLTLLRQGPQEEIALYLIDLGS